MEIVFLRHGESLGNQNGKFYNDDRTNFLSLRGILQAQLAGHTILDNSDNHDNLFDATFASALTRSGQTACIALQTMMDTRDHIQIDTRLNEWCFNADGSTDWYLAEDELVFWHRMISFYYDVIEPVLDTEVRYFIVSHYYTMQGLFDIIARRNGTATNKVKLDPYSDGDIPNAIPFIYNSKSGDPPIMINSGDKSR